MRIIEPSFEIISQIDSDYILRFLETCGRVCYKSEDAIKADSAKKLIKHMIDSGHESPLEHFSISVRIVCDRGVSHEWVRHRIASYSQESTRYCNYIKEKFGSELTFIMPYFVSENHQYYHEWERAMRNAENSYFRMLELGAKPESARSVLPNSLKTEFICTMNLREWRHFFKLRCAADAHPAMREITVPLLEKFKSLLPVLFDDIYKSKLIVKQKT